MREESISEDYPLNASLVRKKKSKGGKLKKMMAFLALLACSVAIAAYAGLLDDTAVSAVGDSDAEGAAPGSAIGSTIKVLQKLGKFVCTTGMTGGRIMGVAGSVSSLVGAGLYTCVGEGRPAKKLGVVAFYSSLLYLICSRVDLGLCALV